MEDFMIKSQEMVMFYGMKVIIALVILIFGKWIAGAIRNSLQKMMTKRNVDATLVPFATNLIYTLLMVFVIIAALGQLGIQTTSLVAILGAAGLAVGLALQGSLSNFASGVLIIIFRPFKVGDYIEGGGTAGTVESIQIFITKLKTPDNKEIYVPNSTMMGGNIVNYSAQKTRRVDLSAGIGYSDDIDKARKVLEDILKADERVLKDPPALVAVTELADSSVNFVVRPWVKSEDYWGVYYDVTETIKKRFDEEGISIPFPQQDVHLFQEK
ncbi:MAG: mechanosensitive ion channel [FCB group bacterium]|nr:mechanosensitive ion channel [FCB group bacterium]